MKNNHALLPIFVLSIALTACGSGSDKGDQSRDDDGSCTYEFVSAYNNIVHEVKMYNLSSSAEKAYRKDAVLGACDKFAANHNDVASCAAEVNHRKTEINPSSMVAECNSIRAQLNPAPTPAPTTAPVVVTPVSTPAPTTVTYPAPVTIQQTDDERVLEKLNSLDMRVLNTEMMSMQILQGKRIQSSTMTTQQATALYAGAYMCAVVAAPQAKENLAISNFVTLKYFTRSDDHTVTMSNVTNVGDPSNVSVICVALEKDKPFKLKGLREALQGVASFSNVK